MISAMARSNRSASAAELAEQIQQLALELPPGAFIGVEADLLARFKVGRGTLRQAIRCLERRGVAHMQRGSAGGLVVTNDETERLAKGLSLALEMLGPPLGDLSGVGAMFRREAAGQAALRSDEAKSRELISIARQASQTCTLSQYAECRGALLRALSMASGDLILVAVIEATSRAVRQGMPIYDMLYSDFNADVTNLKEADCAIAAAIAARDPHGAQSAADISAGIEFASFRRAMDAGRLPDPATMAWRNNARALDLRAAQRIAWTLRPEINQAPAGASLGSEQALAARFQVGRAVMREALRLLAEFGLVQHRRGAGGGVFAGRFDPWMTTASLAGSLRQMPGDLWRVRALVEAEAARQAALEPANWAVTGEPVTRYLVARSGNTVLANLLALFAGATAGEEAETSPYDDRLLTAIIQRDAFFARRFAIERCRHLSQVKNGSGDRGDGSAEVAI